MATKTKRARAASASDLRYAAILAGMARSASSISDCMDEPKTKLPEGAYAIDITLRLRGDVTIGAPRSSNIAAGPAVKAEEILAAIFAGKSRGEIAEIVRPALDKLERLHGKDKASAARANAAIAPAEVLLASVVEDECKKRETLWDPGTKRTIAGKTEGKVSVKASGRITLGEVEEDIEFEAEGEDE